MNAAKRARHGLFEALEVRCLLSINPITTTLTPFEIAQSYGIDDATFGPVGSPINANGGAETIALVEAGDDTNFVNSTDGTPTTTYPKVYGASDLAMFDNQYGLGDVFGFKVVGDTGGARPNFEQDPGNNPANDEQIALDVEWAHAMAPQANIVLIETPDESGSAYMTAVTAGVAAVGAQVVLLTGSDFNDENFGPTEKVYQEGVLTPAVFNQPGVTFIDGSGDSGAPALALADYPDVVSVAASNTTLNNDGFDGFAASWSNDTGWSDPPGGVINGDNGGSGGGYTDDVFPTPTYQQGLVISDGNQTVSSFGERVTPDVSFPGGNNGLPFISNGATLNTATDQDGTFDGDDGTELAADAFAGVVAIADEGLNIDGDAPMDSMQTLTGLYSVPSYDYHDITTGFNGFSAGAGYDLVSGLGTPIANQLIPDLARGSGNATHTVWAGLDYEAPEAYAAGATNPTPNYLTLELGTINGVSSIEIYNSSTSTSLGTLVAADPLASTSVISINGGAYANNSLTVNFTNGNPIPLGGLTYNGATFDDGGEDPTTGLPTGTISLTIQGQLPAIAGTPPASSGQLSSGVWSTEVERPTGPNSGLISLGGLFNINYYNVTQDIHDMTPATNVSYTALGSNTEDVLLNIGPNLPVSPGSTTTAPSTQVSSSTPNPSQFEFVLVDFINKTGVTLGDSDGNDTLVLNFTLGNPLPPTGLTFNGGTGTNSVKVTGGGNFTLGANATITNTTLGGGGLSLINEQNVLVNGTTGDQYFTVTNWLSSTGQPIPLTIQGGTGHDQIYVRQNGNFTVNDSVVTTSNQLTLTMIGISYLELYNTNAGGIFNVNNWTSSDGLGLYLIGSAGPNTFNIGNSASPLGLDAISAPLTVIAQGGKFNTINLNDQASSGFNDYTFTQNSITSVFDPIEGNARPFKGVSMANFTSTSLPTVIQTVNVNPDPVGSTFNVTPNANTTYNVNGQVSPQGLENTLNLPSVGPQSPTLFLTSGPTFVNGPAANNTGFFMFANDKGINFQNMQSTNFPGSVGAITAVAGTAGVASKPIVTIINSVTGQVLQTISLGIYPTGYTGGIQVALGDVTGDGIPDLIVAPGVGTAPLVGVYNILTGQPYETFLAQTSSYNYGLRVAVGDVTGDGKQDLITAPLVGPGNVNVFVNNGSSTSPFNAYTTSTPTIKAFSNITGYQGGVGGVTVGNLTNNPATANDPGGVGDIVIGSGVGTPAVAQVYTFNANTGTGTLASTITPLFSAVVSGGIAVAVADVTGDGIPDLVMGAGTNAASQVDVYNGATKAQNQFTAFTGTGSTAAVHVAIAKINGVNDLLVAQNTGGQSHQIKTFTATGAAVGTAFAETQSWLQSGINLD